MSIGSLPLPAITDAQFCAARSNEFAVWNDSIFGFSNPYQSCTYRDCCITFAHWSKRGLEIDQTNKSISWNYNVIVKCAMCNRPVFSLLSFLVVVIMCHIIILADKFIIIIIITPIGSFTILSVAMFGILSRIFLGRAYGVTGGLIKCSWCFLFFQRVISELPRPITAKLRHMIAACVYFINWLQKFGEPSPKKTWGPKTCKISVDFIQPSTLIANISGTA